MRFIDLNHTIKHGMAVFPGEAEPSIIRDALPENAGYVTHRLESNMHTGTHIDAPFHVKSDQNTIDTFAVELFSGSARAIDVRGLSQVMMRSEWEPIFSEHEIILFCTGFSSEWGREKYYSAYPEFEPQIAEALVRCGVRIAGFDSPSPDKSPFEFHSIFLHDKRFLIENLTNLEELLDKQKINFMSFPLKIAAEASLIRAVAILE